MNKILSCDLYFLSSKTSGKVTSVVRHSKHLARRSTIENTVLNDLIQWMLHSGVKCDDELLSRYSSAGRKKTVIRKDVRTAIKAKVIEMGLPLENFSNKSLRSGFSSHVIANGMGEYEMIIGGGWTENSEVPKHHYTHQMRDRGALALATSETGAQYRFCDRSLAKRSSHYCCDFFSNPPTLHCYLLFVNISSSLLLLLYVLGLHAVFYA